MFCVVSTTGSSPLALDMQSHWFAGDGTIAMCEELSTAVVLKPWEPHGRCGTRLHKGLLPPVYLHRFILSVSPFVTNLSAELEILWSGWSDDI